MYRTLLGLSLLLWPVRFSAGDEPAISDPLNDKTTSTSTSQQESPFVHLEELTEFRPPITLISAGEFWDGGTIWVHMRDSKGIEVHLCVSQNTFENEVPPNTLFLNAEHVSQGLARLPFSATESALVVKGLTAAVEPLNDRNWRGYLITIL